MEKHSIRSTLLAYILIFSALLLSACGGGGSSNPENDSTDKNGGATAGVIALSGADTATVGTQLAAGYIGSSLAAEEQPDYIVIVDQSSTVTFEAPNILTPNLSDPNNGFVLVVFDDRTDKGGSGTKGISMSISVNGEKYDYSCTTYTGCGLNSISLSIENKTISFNNTEVVGNNSNLTLNGTLTWGGSTNPNPNPNPTGSNISIVSGSQLGSNTTLNSLLRKDINFSLDTPNSDFSLGAAYAAKSSLTSTTVYWMAEITNTSDITHCFISLGNSRFLASDNSELGTGFGAYVYGEMRIIGSDIYTDTCLSPGGSGHVIGIELNISMDQLSSIVFETLTVSSSANQAPALSMSAPSYVGVAPDPVQDIELSVINAGPVSGVLGYLSLSLLLDSNDEPLMWSYFSLPTGESGELTNNEATILESNLFYDGSSNKLIIYLDYEALTANLSTSFRGISLKSSVLSKRDFSTKEEYLQYVLNIRDQGEQLKKSSQ